MTKGLVIVSTLLAAGLEAFAGARAVPSLVPLSLAGFVFGVASGTLVRKRGPQLILLTVYLSPAVFLTWVGFSHISLDIVWICALLGLVVSGRGAWRWSLPLPWRWPIAAWALVVSVSWPIVLFREFDFAWMPEGSVVPAVAIGHSPRHVAMWIAYSVLAHNLGLLWFDWLHRVHGVAGGLDRFRAVVAAPLGAAAVLACGVAIYQGFVDIHFLSGSLWPWMRRTPGTFMDPNVFGMIAALWGPLLAVLFARLAGARRVLLSAVGLSLSFTGVWLSGSRTALLTFAVGLAAVLAHEIGRLREARPQGQASGSRRLIPHLVVVVMVAGMTAVLLSLNPLSIQTPLQRSWYLVPGLSAASLKGTVHELWVRDGYGTAASAMVRQEPWAGVGVGGFNTLVTDYAVSRIPPDNAQNWYRHALAELGLIGSLPWVAWCLLLLWALWRRVPAGQQAGRILKGPLVGFGLASLVGAPGVMPSVAITFWTVAFWYLSSVRIWEREPAWVPRISPRLAWAAVLALAVLHGSVTSVRAQGDLLPASRAQRFGSVYMQGMFDQETDADGRPFRWTGRHGVVVIPVGGRALQLEGWVSHPDANERPVDVHVWADSNLIVNTTLRLGQRFAVDVPALPGQRWILIRTRVSRTWRPADFGAEDRRHLGLALTGEWTPARRPAL